MREFLDSILSTIGSESLTDDEYDALPESLIMGYNEGVYNALRDTIQTRGSVDDMAKKLKFFFLAKGVYGIKSTPVKPPVSNIFVGGVLE